MANATQLPSFCFRIEPLEAHTDEVRADGEDTWLPPRRLGANTIVESDSTYFYFNGQATAEERIVSVQSGAFDNRIGRQYQCYSMYCGKAGKIFVLDYNAAVNRVWSGLDHGGINEGDYDPNWLRDWRELTFTHVPERNLSYAAYGAPQGRLFCHLPGQDWVNELFDLRYHSLSTSQHTRGALAGDIALLIGLLALSLPQASISTVLPDLIGRPWICRSSDDRVADPGLAHKPQQGLLITVRLARPDAINEALLAQYERGELGPPFA